MVTNRAWAISLFDRPLFVTINTVEGHLSHAYAKLGVHSRAQLAHRLGSSGQ